MHVYHPDRVTNTLLLECAIWRMVYGLEVDLESIQTSRVVAVIYQPSLLGAHGLRHLPVRHLIPERHY